MAECLPSFVRGRGTSVFQFMMTVGIVSAMLIGWIFVGRHDAAVKAAAGDQTKIFMADEAAWRNMFLVAAVPGILYTLGTFFLADRLPPWVSYGVVTFSLAQQQLVETSCDLPPDF